MLKLYSFLILLALTSPYTSLAKKSKKDILQKTYVQKNYKKYAKAIWIRCTISSFMSLVVLELVNALHEYLVNKQYHAKILNILPYLLYLTLTIITTYFIFAHYKPSDHTVVTANYEKRAKGFSYENFVWQRKKK